MNVMLVLVYGVLISLGPVVASIPFGFVRGFKQARGVPVAEKPSGSVQALEWLLEGAAVIAVTASLGAREPPVLLHALTAYMLAGSLTYALDVRFFKMSIREFLCRIAVGVGVCLPFGLWVASYASA